MEKTLFKDMKEGHMYEAPVLVMSIAERMTKTKKPYCVFVLSDGTEQIQANRFEDRSSGAPATLANNEGYLKHVCIVKLECSSYNGIRSFNIKSVSAAPEGSFKLDDFVMHAPMDAETMYNSIITGLQKQCRSSLKDIVVNIYEQNKEKLLKWSAAVSMHHAFRGGLLYHTHRMLNHAIYLCKIYKGLNSDLLLAAAALHDIGKLQEMDTDELGIAEYTVEGNLLGHIVIGIQMVEEEYRKNPDKYNREEILLLEHLIASHHGSMEYGAAKAPATMEAFALWLVDMTDARMEGCEEAYASMEKGQMNTVPTKGLDTRLYRPTW